MSVSDESGQRAPSGGGTGQGASLAARAQAERRAGHPDRAERMARRALAAAPQRADALAVLGLALLDLGRIDAAQRKFEQLADQLLCGERGGSAELPLTDGELDHAFDRAHPDPEQVIDADRIARQAIEQADLALPEGIATSQPSAFATATMAELLARQGDEAGASRIRAALDLEGHPAGPTGAPPAASDPFERGEGLFPLDGSSRREATVATLERWLANVRRR